MDVQIEEAKENEIEYFFSPGERSVVTVSHALNLVFNSNVEKRSWDREKRVKQKENKEEEGFIFECDSNEELVYSDEEEKDPVDIHEIDVLKRNDVVIIRYILEETEEPKENKNNKKRDNSRTKKNQKNEI